MVYLKHPADFERRARVQRDKKKIYAEGDSWFAYPGQSLLGNANIIAQIHRSHLVLNEASSGDTLANMIENHLDQILSRAKTYAFDVLMFSGGGNDIVDKTVLRAITHDYVSGMSSADCVNQDAFQVLLEKFKSQYEKLILAVLAVRPEIRIVTHCYDYPDISEEGFKVFNLLPYVGPWLYPVLYEERKILDETIRNGVGRILIDRFYETLLTLQAKYSGSFWVVDTRGCCSKKDWENEFHPNVGGYKNVAKPIRACLAQLLSQ